MAMSRKNYIEIAAIIKSNLDSLDETSINRRDQVAEVAEDLARYFKRDNGAFRYSTFFKACGLPVPDRLAGAS